MTLLLIRHGETALNAARILQPADTPLSALGLAQAESLAARLREAGLKGLVSSDMPRARQTAEAIARATGLPLLDDETGLAQLLHERNFGDLRGQPHDSLTFNPLEMEAAPPGGESAGDFRARVAQAFARIVDWRARLDGPLAVVSHGLVIREMLRTHASWSPQDSVPGQPATPPHRLNNTSVSILAAAAPHSALLVDCIRHLEGSGATQTPHALTGG